jgi:hypothetical protein
MKVNQVQPPHSRTHSFLPLRSLLPSGLQRRRHPDGYLSFLVQGENVYGAGEMVFATRLAGTEYEYLEIEKITARTGHYIRPGTRAGRTFGQQFKRYLDDLLEYQGIRRHPWAFYHITFRQ